MLGWLFGKSPRPAPATDARAALAQAYAHHQAGRLDEARAAYEALLAGDPANFEVAHLLAVLELQSGRPQQALEFARRAIRARPEDANAHNTLGEACRVAGALAEAESAYRRAIALDPKNLGAHLNLGHLLRRTGRGAEALDCYAAAISLHPELPETHVCLGEALAGLGRNQDAAAAFRNALERNADSAPAHAGLGNVLLALDDRDEALAACKRALALRPELAVMHFYAANALHAKGFEAEAIAAYQAAIERDPRLVEAHNNLGNVLKEQGDTEQALACYQQALTLKPDFVEALFNAAKLLRERGWLAEAAAAHRSLLEMRPDMVDAHIDLGNALKGMGDMAGALASYRRALELNPDYAEARWALAMSYFPMVAEDEAELARSRTAFAAELTELERWCEARGAGKMARAVGVQQPFYLTYQEGDHRDLFARYGSLCARLMGAWQEAAGLGRAVRVTRADIRVGIVSAHIHDHSVWHAIIKGWLQKLDRNRFDLRLFYLGKTNDVETALAKTLVTHYTYGKSDIVEWAPLILGHQLDVLIYPEVGMDPTTAKLASLRLAPVQAATWGHPHTTGLPTIDYFLSGDSLEPPDAQRHYTERLIRLPGFGSSYEPVPVTPGQTDLAALGVRDGVPLLLCPGTPFKYTPRHDAALIEIARRLGECQFVFFTPKRADDLMQRLRARMQRSFAAAGLDLHAYAVFVPWQNRPGFYGLMSLADVYLDTMGFSGFNTAMQAIECGLPVAAYEGGFLRGRLASGVLRQMGLDELVAADDAAYVDIAVRLARDAAWWGSMRERMVAARPKLYGDVAPVRALEEFFDSAVRK